MHVVLVIGFVLRLVDGRYLLNYLLYLLQDVPLLLPLQHSSVFLGQWGPLLAVAPVRLNVALALYLHLNHATSIIEPLIIV